jgi:hypothetical protein
MAHENLAARAGAIASKKRSPGPCAKSKIGPALFAAGRKAVPLKLLRADSRVVLAHLLSLIPGGLDFYRSLTR